MREERKMSKELKALKRLRNGSYDDYHSTSFEEIYHKEFETINQSLERNEAKKVINTKFGFDLCPNCDNTFYNYEYEDKYCKNCGQRLSWEATDEEY